MALRITVDSSRVLRVEKIPPRFFSGDERFLLDRDTISTLEKFGNGLSRLGIESRQNLPSVSTDGGRVEPHNSDPEVVFCRQQTFKRRIFTIRMRIEANHLIALRQLTLSDENVSSPVLLSRTSTYTRMHTRACMHVFLSPLCSTRPRQTTKFQPQFRQVIDIIRLLDTRCIR